MASDEGSNVGQVVMAILVIFLVLVLVYLFLWKGQPGAAPQPGNGNDVIDIDAGGTNGGDNQT